MGRVMTETVRVTTTGAAGSATGIASTDAINGYLLDVFLDYHASAPAATTDVIITYGSPANGAILTRNNTATDGIFAVRQAVVDATGTALTGQSARLPVDGTIDVNVQGCDALTDALVCRIRYERAW